MKIMAIHGLWASPAVWQEFKEYFQGAIFFTPKINWSRIDYNSLSKQLDCFQPDVIIGHSAGGYIVQRLLENNPYSVKRCVLISPVGPRGVEIRSLYRVTKAFPQKLIYGFLTGKIYLNNYNLAKRFLLSGLPEEISKEFYSQFVPEKTRDVFRVISLFCKNIKKPVEAPTLVISGGLDIILTREEAQHAANFHQASHIHFPNYGHMLLIKEVAQEIKRWITKTSIT